MMKTMMTRMKKARKKSRLLRQAPFEAVELYESLVFVSLTNSLLFVTGQGNTIQTASPCSEWQES